ncbi:MAG: ISAzo13 family transposase [Deltaproteobacteria bacterium]|nr:ISAzo13 family transposase [Deltaproteobacteria bacterium]
MKYETAGDPVTGCKWTRKSTEKIARELARARIYVSPNTAVISVDTKSRLLIGRFHQKGRRWGQEPIKVLDHDFPSDAQGVGIPYGIYDTYRKEGFVCVGTSRDTGQFAVDAIRTWWLKSGRDHYPQAEEVLVLADSGGSNGYRIRLWKYQLQTAFCDRVGLKVRVCHYPPGASKWNPIEHLLFSFVSKNWEAEPLVSYERVLKSIRTTKTKTGLRVRACLLDRKYEKGIKISDDQMRKVNLKRYRVNPEWNYTIAP